MMVLFTVIDIVLLIAGLAVYLYVVGTQLMRVATMLEECADLVWDVKANAEVIDGGLGSINSTGRVIAGALPLLYGMGEGIVAGATFDREVATDRGPAKPATGVRRTRQLEGVAYTPSD
jgi:hypothetical protein